MNAPSVTAEPSNEAELAEFVAECRGSSLPIKVLGGGTRSIARCVAARRNMTTRRINGIVTYEPAALTLIVRAGTSIEEVETTLAGEGQMLAFEPLDLRGALGTVGRSTVGGMVSSNASGPRRVLAGACRDHLLGLRFVDGHGRVIKNGGRVMKNVTGLDLGKLLCGSYGTLGVLTEVCLKTLPAPETQRTLCFHGVSVSESVEIFVRALATPYETSGAAFSGGTAWLRVEGYASQVEYRVGRLLSLFKGRVTDVADDAASRALWQGLRDLRQFHHLDRPLWRVLLKPTDAPAVVSELEKLGGAISLDWGGGLIWFEGGVDPEAVRRACRDGHAVLVRGGNVPDSEVFPPEAPANASLCASLRDKFDPARILNPGLMGR